MWVYFKVKFLREIWVWRSWIWKNIKFCSLFCQKTSKIVSQLHVFTQIDSKLEAEEICHSRRKNGKDNLSITRKWICRRKNINRKKHWCCPKMNLSRKNDSWPSLIWKAWEILAAYFLGQFGHYCTITTTNVTGEWKFPCNHLDDYPYEVNGSYLSINCPRVWRTN